MLSVDELGTEKYISSHSHIFGNLDHPLQLMMIFHWHIVAFCNLRFLFQSKFSATIDLVFKLLMFMLSTTFHLWQANEYDILDIF